MTTATHTMHAIGAPQDSFAYFGDHPAWLIAATVTRDSEAIDRSNFRVIRADLLAQFPEAAAIERAGHWACGWVEYLLVDPANGAAVAQADDWRARLAEYPVASDDDLSELEDEETQETIEEIRQEVAQAGHTPLPTYWESENGYRYEHVCERCNQTIEFCSDSGSWDVPNCTEEVQA